MWPFINRIWLLLWAVFFCLFLFFKCLSLRLLAHQTDNIWVWHLKGLTGWGAMILIDCLDGEVGLARESPYMMLRYGMVGICHGYIRDTDFKQNLSIIYNLIR